MRVKRFIVTMLACATSGVLLVAVSAGSATARLAGPVTRSSPAAQPVWADRGPSLAADQSYGNVYAAWEGTSGYLNVSTRNGNTGQWTSQKLSQMGTLGTQPTIAVTAQANNGQNWQYVFWKGTNDPTLRMAYWGNGSWNGPFTIPNMGTLGSEPAAVFIDNTGHNASIEVYWTGTDHNINYAYSNTPYVTSSWSGPFNAKNNGNDEGPASGPPAPAGTCSLAACTGNRVYWANYYTSFLAKGVYDTELNNWTSGPATYTTCCTLGSPPSAATYWDHQYQTVVWRGSGGTADLWYMTDNNINYYAPQNVGMGPLASAPAVAIVGQGVNTTWFYAWTGTNGDLYDARSDSNGLHGPYDLGIGPICGSGFDC